MSNDPHLAEILILRNQFFTSNVKEKDMVRNIKTEWSTEAYRVHWRSGKNVDNESQQTSSIQTILLLGLKISFVGHTRVIRSL